MKNRIGYLFVGLFWFLIISLLTSCSVQNHHRRSQSNDYSQCWCIDPWDGGAEWCCPGREPKYMSPYKHKKGYTKASF